MALQSDGKIVVAGDTYNGTNYDFALARFEGDAAGTVSATISGGNLTITDSDGTKNNSLTAKLVNISGTDYLEITDLAEQFAGVPTTTPESTRSNGNQTLRVPLGAITGITINGAGGNDTLTIDYSGGDLIPAGGLLFAGGAPTVGLADKLAITGGSFATGVYNVTGTGAGNFVLGGKTIAFTGLEPTDLTGSLFGDFDINVDPLSLVAGTVTTTVAASGGTDTLVSFSGGLESVLIRSITGTLTINGDNVDQDIVNVQSVGSSFAASLTVDGQGGTTDEIHLQTGAGLTLAATKNLSLAAETIDQTGPVTVPGTTNLTAGAANDIVLGGANNFGGAVTIVSARDVTLNDTGTLDFGGVSTVSRDLVVTTAGNITDSGTLAISGTTSLTAGAANPVTLDSFTNNFVGAVTVVSASSVTIDDANAITFGSISAAGRGGY